MRGRTASLRVAAGDAHAEEAVHALLARRLAALVDDGTSPLFFGRLDYDEATDLGADAFHVGRCHIADSEARPVVIDWRAHVARPFYQASPAEPMGVQRRHRYGFSQATVTSMETETLATGAGAGIAEAALAREIERPRIGPMRDIVATIQPEQDHLIRTGIDETLCIQGSPGTGKTAVGLHRAAFLAYSHRSKLDQEGILVVGPNPAFLSYIARVLPGLGETDVSHVTLPELAVAPPVSGSDEPEVARLKGQAVLATVLRRAVFGRIALPSEPLTVRVHAGRYRLEAEDLRALVTTVLDTDVPYRAAKALFYEHLVRRIARQVERRGAAAGFDPYAEVSRAVRSSPEVRTLMALTWPTVEPASTVFTLLSDATALADSAGDLLDGDAVEQIVWPRRPRSRKTAPWSPADAFLLDEAASLVERSATFGHVVVDEAQDLSAMQLRAVGRRCRHSSATLLGDLAQATAPWSVGSWAEALGHLGQPGGRVVELPRAFRNPRSILEFANRLLPLIGSKVTPAASVRDVPGALVFHRVDEPAVCATVPAVVRAALARDGSVGVIAAPEAVGEVARSLEGEGVDHAVLSSFDQARRVTVVAATGTKGLEFDHVVLVEPATIAAIEPAGPAWLYIALTRAVARLDIVHSRPVP